MNKVILVGNLTRDPELRYTPSGAAVADLGIATNRKYKDSSGEVKEEVCFVDLVAWGKLAETMANYLIKGRKVGIEGRLQYESWEKDGQKRNKLRVHVEDFEFLDWRGEREEGEEPEAEPDDGVPF